jgi:O-antigen/teichoic acid export membrane protein
MTRTRKVAGSVALSLLSQAVAMIVGLWLTRFILGALGQHDYGLWLIILQSLGYLALADIGVVAVLPRQTAFTTGKDGSPDALPRLVGETARLVRWQTPVVFALALVAWLAVPPSVVAHRDVLGLVLLLFAASFPLRLYTAVLQGLQDLVFLGWVQFAGWLVSAAVTVIALLSGLGLYSLALAWGVTQLGPPLVARWRLGAKYPHALPRDPISLGWAGARRHLSSALWVSLGQLAGAMVNGADILIIGAVMGPAAVVPYAVTVKLIQVIGNLPVMVAHAAGPGLSQMRAGESKDDLRRATNALAQAVLAGAGIVACVIVAVNQGFVGWWVGADRYAGDTLTLLAVVLMLVRHYGTTIVYAIYSFGHEKRLAVAGIMEGAVSVAAGIALVKIAGPVGAVIGALIAAVLVVMPLILPTLARELATTVGGLFRALLPFALRLALSLAAGVLIGRWLAPTSPWMLAVAALAAAGVYVALVLPVALRPPLREYVLQLVTLVRTRLGLAPAPPAPPAPAAM